MIILGKSQIIFGGKYFSIERINIPVIPIFIFIIVMNLYSILLPKNRYISRRSNIASNKIWFCIFYLQKFFEALFYLYTGFTMGNTVGILENIIIQFILLFSADLLLLFLLFQRINNEKRIWDLLVVYMIPCVLKGSKSGILFFFIYFFVLKFSMGWRINKRYLFLALIIFILFYPIIYEISYYFRNTEYETMSIIPYVKINTYALISGNRHYVLTALDLLSRRVNATDILVLKFIIEDNKIFSALIQFKYILKGLFTSSVVTFIWPGYASGLGAEFAKSIGMIKAGGLETTLFGNIYFSEYSVSTILLYIFFLLMLFWIIALNKNGIFSLYLIIQVIFLVMTGTIQNITYTIRSYLIICVINFFVRNIHLPGFKLFKKFFKVRKLDN